MWVGLIERPDNGALCLELKCLKMSTPNGFGSVTWWGFTPSLNLTALADHRGHSVQAETNLETESSVVQSDHVNVLLVGGGDLRQVLFTLAHAHKHTTKPIHFYLAECCLEVFARHMLFLALLFEPPEKLGLQEKVELFLELYGNTLVRAHTSEYFKETATELIKMVTDQDYLKSVIPILDISALKFKERDLLEGIFKFWRNPDQHTFDIAKHWEGRLRHYLGTRYDTRSGVFDWDYHMKLNEMVSVVNAREYCEWRETGVAFQLRSDAPYECSNRTLASGMIVTQGGSKVARRGYWGDIVNSPYLSFGVYSENKELFKKNNGKHVKSSVHVAEYNITSLIHTLTTGEAYHPPSPSTTAASSKGDMATIQEIEEEEEEEEEDSSASKDQSAKTRSRPLFNGSCFISFLPLNSPSEMNKKAKYKKLFNIAYFSNSMVHHLTNGIETTFAPDCTLVLETARFMLDITKEQCEEFSRKVISLADSISFKVPVQTGEREADHLVFVRGQ